MSNIHPLNQYQNSQNSAKPKTSKRDHDPFAFDDVDTDAATPMICNSLGQRLPKYHPRVGPFETD